MRVIADIDEADIGEVTEGQRVEFTVDAYPNDIFHGEVQQVRLEPTTTSNVVTYEVIVSANNPDLKLKPGMTANVDIIVAEVKNAMTVPNQALRFYFDDGTGAKRYQDRGVWILRGGKPERITVELGVSDDNNTEVKSVELKIGDEVIVSQNQAGEEKMKMRMRMPR